MSFFEVVSPKGMPQTHLVTFADIHKSVVLVFEGHEVHLYPNLFRNWVPQLSSGFFKKGSSLLGFVVLLL